MELLRSIGLTLAIITLCVLMPFLALVGTAVLIALFAIYVGMEYYKYRKQLKHYTKPSPFR